VEGARRGDAPVEVHVLRGVTAIGLGFSNLGDEVLLLNAAGATIDVVTYRDGDYPGVIPHPGVSEQDRSLERRTPRADTGDCSQDFFGCYPSTPGVLPE